ncbi:MAG: c-type cytochrome [Chloroflexota bacterium]
MSKRSGKYICSAFFLMVSAFVLSGCAVSLAADITPPPDAQSFTIQDTPTTRNAAQYPTVPPDPEQGAVIYAEKCAACHGERGMGDGPQAGQLPIAVPPLGDFTLAQGARPEEWYLLVSEGNMERFMPAFRSLDDRQRWDVVAYALTLSMRADTIEQGKALYAQSCQSCHGAAGEGSNQAAGWRDDTSRLASLSLVEMARVINDGKGNMPAFGDRLDSEQRLALASYVRSLSFKSPVQGSPTGLQPEVPQNQNQPETLPSAPQAGEEIRFSVTGSIVNGSGGLVPPGLTVQLEGYDGMEQVYIAQSKVREDGTYTFSDTGFVPGRAFIASVEHNGFVFNSEVYHSLTETFQSPLDLPITIYDTTSDLSALKVDRMHVLFDFTNPEMLQVALMYLLNNTSNRVIVSDSPGGAVLTYALPQEATNLQFRDGVLGERFIETENGFGDTQSIAPGAGMQVLYAYDLPFRRRMDLSIPIPLAVDAAIIMLPQGSMTIQGQQLQPMGQRQVQGVSLDVYTAAALPPGSTLDITLSGRMGSGINIQSGQTWSLIAGALALVAVLAGGGFWYFRQRRVAESFAAVQPIEAGLPESREALIDGIIALDDLYKAGKLDHATYQHRRTELKDRLRSVMD